MVEQKTKDCTRQVSKIYKTNCSVKNQGFMKHWILSFFHFSEICLVPSSHFFQTKLKAGNLIYQL